ncbi:MAG TPA: hypothetical protein VJ760_01375 [Nitrospiraceae bacterium]|nr:hypothetical protein [Nitrospiraceae bacterium]
MTGLNPLTYDERKAAEATLGGIRLMPSGRIPLRRSVLVFLL